MIKGVGHEYNPMIGQGVGYTRPTVATRHGASIFRKALEMETRQEQVPVEPPPTQSWVVEPRNRIEQSPEPVAQRRERSKAEPEQVPLERMLHEVTELAQGVGYIGFTKEDILRAYHTGESFLVDYTV